MYMYLLHVYIVDIFNIIFSQFLVIIVIIILINLYSSLSYCIVVHLVSYICQNL